MCPFCRLRLTSARWLFLFDRDRSASPYGVSSVKYPEPMWDTSGQVTQPAESSALCCSASIPCCVVCFVAAMPFPLRQTSLRWRTSRDPFIALKLSLFAAAACLADLAVHDHRAALENARPRAQDPRAHRAAPAPAVTVSALTLTLLTLSAGCNVCALCALGLHCHVAFGWFVC